ncbi:MAG: SOS response-associated peptidase family protein [Clostridia bacterium]|nr:SOS response-associated peptidase family protein [Clostridia bacterium]MDD3970899.1 SOS response-associated peptidase family protein [Clostridia bacterium]MDD4543194.1 SOS response-associated peptidase family protein [Clostridia bacterium]NLF36260.1 SOS response-associated peptidase [Clostridiaceae bacterium]
MVCGKESAMCGRFLDLEAREIFPSDLVEVETIQGTMDKIWGVVNKYSNKTMINARGETVNELAMFKYMKPCVIPAIGYFEWDKDKKKYLFTKKNQTVIHMAGVYRDDRFVIITKDAYEQFAPIHHRMPYILSAVDIQIWFDEKKLCHRDEELVYKIA